VLLQVPFAWEGFIGEARREGAGVGHQLQASNPLSPSALRLYPKWLWLFAGVLKTPFASGSDRI